MDHNYTVTIVVCVISMIILAIDAGKNTILNKDDIKWFRITFILAALGAICEYLGVLADKTNFCSPKIHWVHHLFRILYFSLSWCMPGPQQRNEAFNQIHAGLYDS